MKSFWELKSHFRNNSPATLLKKLQVKLLEEEEVDRAPYERCLQQRDQLKRIFGIRINKTLSPMQLVGMLAKRIGLFLSGKQIREGEKRTRIYWINQDELVTSHRIEVLNALDRKGEAIA